MTPAWHSLLAGLVELPHGQRQKEIGGLDVAVDQAVFVRVFEAERRLADVAAGARHGERAVLLDELAEVRSLDVLHREEVRARVRCRRRRCE